MSFINNANNTSPSFYLSTAQVKTPNREDKYCYWLKFVCAIFILICFSSHAYAFRCMVNGGEDFEEGTRDIYLTPQPSIQAGGINILLSLSDSISCYNEDYSGGSSDYVTFTSGSSSDVLPGITKSLGVNGLQYPLPLSGSTSPYEFPMNNRVPVPLGVSLTFTAVNNAQVTEIPSGTKFATLNMLKYYEKPGNETRSFTWNIYSNAAVIVPIGGCEVSARNLTVEMEAFNPAQPGISKPIDLSIKCPGAGTGTYNISYYLTGTTARTEPSIFNNVASTNAANGIGIKILNANNDTIPPNQSVVLGQVGNSFVSLGLQAAYALTGEQVTAGSVQSIIGVNFTYQ
ncbi:fimbrial protein [Serratia ureilytica]|uniref:fimbrial protein n=1 Tax=Serratia ureilytica TaxID=300181 RepID=UPI0034C5B38D